jgi:hypothetical protein
MGAAISTLGEVAVEGPIDGGDIDGHLSALSNSSASEKPARDEERE